jgi:predicted small lipoprotein YifL
MSEGGSRVVLACVLASVLVALSGCGQKGPLYLPDEAKEVVTRPTQTPPPAPAPQGSNSPQTPDSPPQPASPAPEVTPPTDKDRDQKPGTTPPPPR